MGFYTITSHSGAGLRLTVATNGILDGRTNVNISNAGETNVQRWKISSLGNGVQVKSTRNIRYMLNASSTYNCDVYTANTDTNINFVYVSQGVYRLQLASNTQKYLTVNSQTNLTSATWENLDINNAGQKWKVTATTCSFINANAWLKMKTNPTGSNGRTVNMPTVSAFIGSDGYSYQFANNNYWYAYEPPYLAHKINSYAYNQILAVTGNAPNVILDSEAAYIDLNGNYWVAVGPNVVNPNHASDAEILPSEMYAKGRMDVVVKDSDNTYFYIPAVVGDAKNHTWSNGIIQTYKAYPNGAFSSAGGNFNGKVCVEFIGYLDGKLNGLGTFSIVEIRFYDS